MKNSSKIKKSDYESDYRIFGIVSQAKDFKICFDLNNVLEIEMKREEKDLELFLEAKSDSADLFSTKIAENNISYHSVFHVYDELKKCDFYLLSNYGTKGILLPEFKQCNYLLMLSEDAVDNELANEYLDVLNQTESITMCFELEEKQIKSIHNILL